MTILFWASVFLIFYVYAGYPITALIISRFVNRFVIKQEIYPPVTILIAAYNEEACIEATIRNKLDLDYPKDKLEVIVISDESSDNTDSIVQSFASSGVKLIRQVPRAGKTAALNLALPSATGEIIVFSDANSIYAPDALKALASNFADPDVGYVTGKMIYVDKDGTPVGEGCSAYMKYENMLREIETRLGSVVGVDGGIDAMRKKLYSPLRADQLPDFVQPLMVIEKGFRVVYEPDAVLCEDTLKESCDEYRMRVRVTLRALWALKDMRGLLFGRGGWLFSWQLWSHKVLRYLCFIFLISAFFSNMFIAGVSAVYCMFFIIQVAFYLCAASLPLLGRIGSNAGVLQLPYYFVLLNLASFHATIKFLQGKKQVLWQPRKG